jgi:hypothetical protein
VIGKFSLVSASDFILCFHSQDNNNNNNNNNNLIFLKHDIIWSKSVVYPRKKEEEKWMQFHGKCLGRKEL